MLKTHITLVIPEIFIRQTILPLRKKNTVFHLVLSFFHLMDRYMLVHTHTLQRVCNSIIYLESNPNNIDASSCVGQCRSLVPDVRQMFIPHEQVNERISQRALVLVTGHYEIIHDKWCKHEQEKDACQGKPVYLPVIQKRTFFFQLLVMTAVLIKSSNFSLKRPLKTENIFRAHTFPWVKQ